MAHLVLARKYRPLRFGDLVGQDPLTRILQNAIRTQKLGHAFLFHGVRGVGKTTAARILARAINCSDPEAQEKCEPCNKCATCRAILEDRHIDIIEMDAASHTGVDDIRPLIEAAPYRPQSAQYKVYIIDEVHMLSKSAFNALLKTLEEPPPHIKFIFATTEIRRIPPTILSRCLRFDLARLSVETLVHHFRSILMQEGVHLSEEAIQLVAKAADGSARDGLSILDQLLTSEEKSVNVRQLLGLAETEEVLQLMGHVVQGQVKEALAVWQDMYKKGAEPSGVVQELLPLIHALMHHKLGLTPGESGDYPQEVLTQWASFLSQEWLLRVWQILLKTLEDLKIAPQGGHVLEVAVIKCVLIRDGGSSISSEGIQQIGGGASPIPQSVKVHPEPHSDTSLPKEFSQMVALFVEHREPLLYTHLKQDVQLVEYQPGRVVLHLLPHAPKDLIVQLTKKLQSWTGFAWQILASKEPGHSSLRQQEEEKMRHSLTEALDHPVAQSVLEAFPAAEVALLP